MEIYDYRTDEPLELDMQFDQLSNTERQQLNEAMKQIREETKQAAAKQSRQWFNDGILPVLKKFAETGNSILEIDEARDGSIVATFRNHTGYNLLDTKKRTRMILGLAAYADIRIENEDVILELVFVCDGLD